MRVSRIAALAGLFVSVLWVGRAAAVYETENYKVEGQVSVQPAFQHNDGKSIAYVQQRQEIRLGGIFHLVPVSHPVGILNKADIALLWRGRYDAIFDIRDQYKSRGYDRNDFRFPEGSGPREFYGDIEFNGALQPLSFRVGRQQIVWGEADFFRSLDVINPLRIDQMTLVGDDLDNYREPLWIAKALYHFGDFNYVSGVTAEGFWSPDGRPLTNKLVLGDGWRVFESYDCIGKNEPIDCKRPHSRNFRAVRYPWEIERVGPEYSTAPDQGDLGPLLQSPLGLPLGLPASVTTGKADFIYLGHRPYGDTTQLNSGDYQEIDMDRQMAGIRLMGQTSMGGLYFTLNYIWKRAEIPAPYIGWETLFSPTPGDDTLPANPVGYNLRTSVATPAAAGLAAAQVGNFAPNQALLSQCFNDSKPTLILGGVVPPGPNSAPLTTGRTPYGYDFPSTGLGAACVPVKLWYPYTHIFGGTLTYNDDAYTGFIWRIEESLSTKEPRESYPALAGTRAGTFPNSGDFYRGGKEKTAIWRSMVGFDYLRSITRYSSLPTVLKQVPLTRSLLTDQWFFTFQFFNEYWSNVSNQLGQDFSLTNRHMHWNPMFTWIMTGFFMHEHLRPTLAFAYETDTKFPVLWLQMQYFLTPQLQVRIGEVNYMGSAHAENFLFLNKYSDRDTSYIRFTYFFL